MVMRLAAAGKLASDRFWRSSRLVPGLKRSKAAISVAMEESNRCSDYHIPKDGKDEHGLHSAFEAVPFSQDAASERHSDVVWERPDFYSQASRKIENC